MLSQSRGGTMKTYEIVIVSKEYRYFSVEAESAEEAREIAWGDIENHINGKAHDYDTELYVEGEATDAASYT